MDFILAIPAMVWLIISAVFFAFGEFLSKKFALAPSVGYVILILFIYSLGALAWLPAIFEKKELSIVGAIWSVLSLLATVLIGVLIFDEKLNVIAITGIILGIIAVALLSMA
jgi:multidrug transporter EmrE-like cation transporter